MGRLIDADALTEHMRKAYEGNKKNGFKWDLESTVVVIECEEEINRPIVRCKDCKYWKDGYCDDSLIEGLERKVSRFEDDFCSRGGKK